MDYAKAYGKIHEQEKRFHGYSIAPYVKGIGDLVARVHAAHKTGPFRLMDYGCGKGYQYLVRRYHERWGAPLPYCYDIGVPQLSTKPEGRFQGVICTDMLEHIERKDVPAILDELIGYTEPGGFLFLGISCRPSRKRLPDGRDVHVTVEPPLWWISQVTDRLNKTGRDQEDIYVKAVFDLGEPPHFQSDAPIKAWDTGA